MTLLLDTHVFIWWATERSKLPDHMRALCVDKRNALRLSVGSVWEMQIKQSTGKLTLNLPWSVLVEEQRRTNEVELLPIEFDHVLALETLPRHHKDPFDRIIIAQAVSEDFTVLSVDPLFTAYPVKLIH